MYSTETKGTVGFIRPMVRLLPLVALLLLAACKSSKSPQTGSDENVSRVPADVAFSADSAYLYCAAQCDFGARTMNSEAHERCAAWIISKFEQFGCLVSEQKATLTGYDGASLKSTNIIASMTKQGSERPRLLLCAHWDSRPWADNDPDEANHRKPVLAANDGASGVAVMLELARLLSRCDSVPVDIDFVCFDAEDRGTPQWEENQAGSEDTWALGARHWAEQYAASDAPTTVYRYGILLDMVGGQGARFYREGFSRKFADDVVDKVWKAARTAGYGSMFPEEDGGYITDDHVPVNETAGIKCADIIPYYPDCSQSSFGPTWHTVSDDMKHIDKNTLQGVGQTLLQVIFSEN